MSKFKYNSASVLLKVFVFLLTLSVSSVAYLYATSNEPVLYGNTRDVTGFPFFIQNPFRDKTKENVAESFLNSIIGKEIKDSFGEFREVIYKQPGLENEVGKLSHWKLQNRIDKENETTFFYYIYRTNPDRLKRPKNSKYLLSFVVLKLNNINFEWKVKEYNCNALSWNDW
jgi:hypothetical protein